MIGKHIEAIRQALNLQSSEEKPAKKKSEELDFLPAYLEIMERPPSNVARLFVFSIMLLCVIALTWSILGKVDIIASSPGQLVIGGGSKTIQAPENGEITAILVRDGQIVKKGDALIRLNPIQAQAEILRLRQQIGHSGLEVARLTALVSDDPENSFNPPQGADPERVKLAYAYMMGEYREAQAKLLTFKAQLSENEAKRETTERVIANTASLLSNVQERFERFSKLAEKGNYPKLQLLELEKEMLEQKRELEEQQSSLKQLEGEARTLKAQMGQSHAEWRRSLLTRLDEERRSLIDYEQELVKAMEIGRLQIILAPTDGRVQELSVHTIGGVVTPGQELMKVVPEEADLEAEIKVLNKDAGHVIAGQSVEVKVDSFPYTKYGTIKGEVLHKSNDATKDEDLGDVFFSRVKMSQLFINVEGKQVPLTAGMRVTAEIKTGERRVIDFLLDPLKEYASEALSPR
ncbi:HlyD family type I secretion periplasmic adaptor subunit [Aestuariispira insulae]|uniref:Membrane fusion protein (MFP) family protein n=1 Tax=Aestuariispira insulae TaxID=1461337 RepID=A0A3D9H5E5_9PROT|nr:HlyD family type I secretion periplasmic adaptor subunit [Aestuariispira insulae]RED44659.1 RTX toxin transport system membrane fusion protein [Aestuariispira insulae]